MKYVCELCGLIYDEEAGYPKKGIAPGTPFADLPDSFECPGCFSERQAFSLFSDSGSHNEKHAVRPEMPVLACTDVKEESER